MKLSGSVAIVTGGGGSIGSAICRRLDREGVFTYVADIRADAAEAVVATMRHGQPVAMDVTDPKAWGDLVRRAQGEHGSVDLLVDNAATHLQALVADTSDADWDRVVRTNAFSVFYGCRAVVPRMKEQGRGVIVNIVTGQFGVPYSAAYTSSKFMVQGFSLCLALEVARSGIRVNTIAPGVIPETGFEKYYRQKAELVGMPYDAFMASTLESIPLGRYGDPTDVAEAVLYLASDAASYITGQLLNVDGGFAGYASSVHPREA